MEDAGPAPGDELVAGRTPSTEIRTVPQQSSAGIVSSFSGQARNEDYLESEENSGRGSRKASSGPPPAPDVGSTQPGAHQATGRPVGNLPVWCRRGRRRSTHSGRRSSQSHLPPEMRTQNSQTSRLRQSVMNLFAGSSNQMTDPSEEVRSSRGFGGSRRTRRSILQRVSVVFAGDAVVETPEQIEEERDKKEFKKEMWAVIACIIVVIGVSVGVAVAVTSGGDDDVPISALSPTAAPKADIAYLSDRAVTLKPVLEYLSSDPSVLEDPTTPQYGALVWLADLDEAVIDPADSLRLETRYALATIYYATDGDNWFQNLGFLSPMHECDWNVETEQFPAGFSCNSEEEVFSLNLGEFLEFVAFFWKPDSLLSIFAPDIRMKMTRT
jgi:hypothetical protein